MRLGLGGGRKGEDWVVLDRNPVVKPHVLRDVLKGLPFSNESVDAVLAEHFLEHFAGEDLIFVFNEVHRVLKDEGVFEFSVPQGVNAVIDPTHKSFFNHLSFNFFVIPDYNSQTAGVKGWFHAKKIVLGDGELRCFFEKVDNGRLNAYLKEHRVSKEDGLLFNFKTEVIDGRVNGQG